MSHYKDAETMLALAEQRARQALSAADDSGNPMDSIPGMVGALIDILVAQVHATLAVADEAAGL